MVDVEQLARKARWLSERRRVQMALRVWWMVAALTIASLGGATPTRLCVTGGLLLALAAIALRWWNQAGVDAVWIGLSLGSLPLATGVALHALGVKCGTAANPSRGDALCVLAGIAAGIGIALVAARTVKRRMQRWIAAIVVASITAMLGCAGLGLAGVLATLTPLVVSSALAWIPARSSATVH